MSVALILIAAALAAPSAPPTPIAGPFSSAGEILKAAHAGGIDRLRVETYSAPKMGDVRLYVDDGTAPSAMRCLSHWETANGRRPRLKPRWWQDDFTRDDPLLSPRPSSARR